MSEQAEQETLVTWCDWNSVPIFAIPNGGRRDKREAAGLKRAGVRAGVPDLMIPVARHGYHGMFIELKVGNNKPTAKQTEWLCKLFQNGYYTRVCYGALEAVDAIKEYLHDDR